MGGEGFGQSGEGVRYLDRFSFLGMVGGLGGVY